MEPPHSTSDAPFLRSSAHEGSKLMTKARKTSNRREDMAAHYAFGPSEDDVIIRQRLLTRTTTTRGEPPLKKLLKKFLAFAGEVEKNTDNVAECEKMYKSLLQELSTFELPLLKTRVVIDANVREQQNFQVLQEELDKQILQAHKDIEELKVQLEESKVERQHKEECETIRRLIAAQPPRAETQKALNELNKEISSLETENTNANRTVELRKKQFALLLYAIDSLQSTLDEEQTNNTEQESSIVAVLPTEATNTAEPMCIETT